MLPIAAVAFQLLSYPGMTGHIADWPQDLPIYEHTISTLDVQRLCGFGTGACARPNLVTNRCDIYKPEWAPEWVLEHEREHCRGGTHRGVLQLTPSPMVEQFERWAKAGKPHADDPLKVATCLADNPLRAERLPEAEQAFGQAVAASHPYQYLSLHFEMPVATVKAKVAKLCGLLDDVARQTIQATPGEPHAAEAPATPPAAADAE